MMTTQPKKMSLYNLANEYQLLFSQLYDPETGEVNELVQAKIDSLAPTTEEKCVAIVSWIKSLESEKREIEFLKNEIIQREEAYNKSISKWQDYLIKNMERCKITEVKCPYFTIKLKKNPYSTDVFDESQIPENFMRKREIIKTEIKPDREKIKEEVLRTGIQVPGANVTQKTKLVVSIKSI